MVDMNVEAYWRQAAKDYQKNAYKYEEKQARYPFYEMRLQLVLDLMRQLPKGTLLDAGCGGANVLIEFLNNGWDGRGFDLVPEMVSLARQNLTDVGYEKDRVIKGSVTDLSAYQNQTFDVILSLGVMEYISPSDERQAFSEVHRVLKSDGVFIVEDINNLFDLSTFNRFTLEFYKEHFLSAFFQEENEVNQLEKKLSQLITNPTKPETSGTYSTTRDQVYTKSENPLIYGQKVKHFGFTEQEQAFYRFHAVPPLLFESNPELERVAIAKELELSRHWIGHFLASGFISVLKKSKEDL